MAVSLRRRLLVILIGLILAIWLVSVVITAVIAQQMIVRQIDRQLVQYMDMAQHTLLMVLRDPEVSKHFKRTFVPISSQPNLKRIEGFGSQGRGQATNLWFGDSQVLVGEQTPAFPRPTANGVVTTALRTGNDRSRWRIMYRYDPQVDVWLGVGVDLDQIQSMGSATFWRVIMPLLVILPVTGAVLFWGVGRGLRPLNDLADKIAVRKPAALEAIDTIDVPQEMRPVVDSLNGLLDRLQRALTSERRFTANAAHELQTPLAAIKAEVQRCQRQTNDSNTRIMLERISARVVRAVDTVGQLLTLARLDTDEEFPRQQVELGSIVVEVMAEVGAVAVDRGIEVKLDNHSPLYIEGNAEWLKILLRNLLVNAFSHSPSPAEVDVRLLQDDGGPAVMIANDCEPIPEEELSRLTDRFYRPSGSGGNGVGLGLSIVQRIAQLHGATLRLGPWQQGRGFVAEIRFPLQD